MRAYMPEEDVALLLAPAKALGDCCPSLVVDWRRRVEVQSQRHRGMPAREALVRTGEPTGPGRSPRGTNAADSPHRLGPGAADRDDAAREPECRNHETPAASTNEERTEAD